MTGFAAVWNIDGEPVDEAVLFKMQDFLSTRGPDEQRVAIVGRRKNVGLIHAAFHTSLDSQTVQQPFTIDGNAWLTGQMRIDAREELRELLRAKNAEQSSLSDAQMILLAYKTWGQNFLKQILGDFSFVIWDEREERIIGVRDHFGTRPFFYARAGNAWIISNSINCIRLHPGVSNELDDIWIRNYLASTRVTNAERTVYRDIKRLPPGHLLDLTLAEPSLKKYWRLELQEPLIYKRRDHYQEHFRELLKTAISERIRTNKVGSEMSGGLDSTSQVAFILQLVKGGASGVAVQSNYFESLINHDEQRYAQAAADYLGVSVHFEKYDDLCYQNKWWLGSWVPPEPHEVVLSHSHFLHSVNQGPFRDVRVLFVGHGPDDWLKYMDRKAYLQWLFKTRRFPELLSSLSHVLRSEGCAGAFSRAMATIRPQRSAIAANTKPAWLRQGELDSWNYSGELHPWHPAAITHLHNPNWQDLFDGFDPATGGWLIEAVYPYFDLRMVKFLLSLPVIPWCDRKLIIRESMRGMLPELVLTRDKTPLFENPWAKAMVRHPLPPIAKTEELSRFIDILKIPTDWPEDPEEFRLFRRLLALQFWLDARQRIPQGPF